MRNAELHRTASNPVTSGNRDLIRVFDTTRPRTQPLEARVLNGLSIDAGEYHDARAQEQEQLVQNAPAPSFLQTFGWRN
jgi:hypothetical protein